MNYGFLIHNKIKHENFDIFATAFEMFEIVGFLRMCLCIVCVFCIISCYC